MGGPGRRFFEAVAWFDQKIIDGAVNGAAKVVQGSAGTVRKGQTGYVRSYAAIIGVGVVGLLAWFVIGRGIL
jgi:NADH-quinone oxidoreductase subunit L